MRVLLYLRVGGRKYKATRGIIGLNLEDSRYNNLSFICIHPEHHCMRKPSDTSEKYKQLLIKERI